jgi:hypothetical protein
MKSINTNISLDTINENENENNSDNESTKIHSESINNDEFIEKITDKIVDKLKTKLNSNNYNKTSSDVFKEMINTPSGAETVSYEEQVNALQISLWKNKYFYIIALLCCFILASLEINQGDNIYKRGYLVVRSIYSLVFAMLAGHTIHWLSHHVNCNEYLDSCDNLLTNNKYIRTVLNAYADVIDFHSITHHDSSINKRWYNILYEMGNNFLTQSVAIVWLIQRLDFKVILLWGLMYATVHNINYLYLKPTTHRDHHAKATTNYGIDVTDILFNTKYNWNDIETHNHAGINLLIITLFISLFYLFNKKINTFGDLFSVEKFKIFNK